MTDIKELSCSETFTAIMQMHFCEGGFYRLHFSEAEVAAAYRVAERTQDTDEPNSNLGHLLEAVWEVLLDIFCDYEITDQMSKALSIIHASYGLGDDEEDFYDIREIKKEILNANN